MANLLMDQIAILMQLGRRAVDLSDCCKGSEPSFAIRFHNDGMVSVDFYSYCLNLEKGGRHHIAEARTQTEMEQKLAHWIILAEKEVKEAARADRDE